MPRKKRKAKEKLPFWKKHPELKRITRHLGKMIDNESLTDFLAGLGCFLAGSIAAYNIGARKIEDIIGTGFSGLIAYKLARSENLVAGASGTLYLAGLGLIDAWNPITGVTHRIILEIGETIEEQTEEWYRKYEELTKPYPIIGKQLFRNPFLGAAKARMRIG